MEFISIKFSTLLFMVSESMFEHYKQKYRLKRTHNIIMPCYNAEKLQKIDYSKYNHPSFVFAGGTSSWHCAKEIIETYKYIENEVPESSITLLSSAKVQFEKLIKEYGVKNYEIKYVPLDQLQIELMKYKYGFLIRDKHIINNVATPTKMSSYLGAGIIPIFTNAIDDFVKHIHLGAFSLLFKTPIDTKTIAEAIIHFENTDHDYSEYLSIVNNVFDDYYNSQKYISIISPELLKL